MCASWVGPGHVARLHTRLFPHNYTLHSAISPLFPTYQRSKDAERCDNGADEKGGVESGREGIFHHHGYIMRHVRGTYKGRARDCAAQAGEDRACQGHADEMISQIELCAFN